MDNAGNLLIADKSNSRIFKMTTTMPISLTNTALTLNKISINNLSNYSVVISSSGGSVTSRVATLSMAAFILSPPQGVTVADAGSATFNVTAGGTGPFSYQWIFSGTNIDGATNNALTLTNIQPGQAGAYTVVVSNQFGSATNSGAVLNPVPFMLASQPKSQSAWLGSNVLFSVSASGQGPFSYQWQFQNVSLIGATNSTLALTNLQASQSGGVYSVTVSNAFGTIASTNATLVVNSIFVWGGSFFGSPNQTNIPAFATNVLTMAAGDAHCVALMADGTVVAWGDNEFDAGETNVPSGLSNVVSVAAGSTHSLALKSDGTLAAWGVVYPSFQNPISVPPQATNVAALALGPGAQHALVLKNDGTVLDWGNNNYGLTNIPPLAQHIVAVASGDTYCLALRSDGSVVTWGNNPYGLTVPASATNIVAIAAGWRGNAALRANGTVLTWGSINSPASSFTNFIDLACPGNSTDSFGLRRNGALLDNNPNPGSLPKYPTNTITSIAVSSYNFAVVGNGPPVFPGMAINRTVASGSRAYFRALAVGTMPINYQWLCNGTNVIGATNSVMTLTNVQPVLAGNYYSLIASNAVGVATNGAMFLNEVPLEFSIQPQLLSTVAGATANFTLAYTNGVGPFTWQWQFNNNNLDGATNSFLSLTNVQLNQAGAYSLVAGNGYGSVTNNAAMIVQPFAFTLNSTNLMFTTNGLQLSLSGVFATNSVVLYASTDLISWLPILTNSPATGAVQFLDLSATNWPQRFYRASQK